MCRLLSVAGAALVGLVIAIPTQAQHHGHTPPPAHYDYTPSHYDRHRLHYDYTPGHYDAHQGSRRPADGHYPGDRGYTNRGYYQAPLSGYYTQPVYPARPGHSLNPYRGH